MTVQEAKDFLVAQAAQQAALEGTALSDMEKRMMYFTERMLTAQKTRSTSIMNLRVRIGQIGKEKTPDRSTQT